PWGLRSGGDGSGLFRSTDGGDTWTEITRNPGLPTGTTRGRIGVAVTPVNPQRVWAIIDAENRQKGVYRSDDAGATWQRVSDHGSLTQRPWYYHHIYADTKDPETVYVLNTGLWKSTDGGKTFRNFPQPHGDNHDLWIDPNDPSRLINANDGGATVSLNGGKTWSSILNQPTAQLYHVTTDMRFPYRLYGAQQDNSTISVPSRSPFGEITQVEWYAVGGGEAGYVAVDPEDPEIVFAADHWWLTRYDNRTKDVKWISPWPELYYGWGAGDLKYRLQWTHPVLISPHDPNALYLGSHVVLKSTDEGHSWQVVSPDLTRADPEKLEKAPRLGREQIGKYWGPITRDASGIEHYGVIFTLAESPVQKGLWWAGSDDGLIHVSRDDGKTWQNVTPKEVPEWALMSIINPSPHDPASAYVAATRYKLQDNRPYLYKTSDHGRSWTKITTGIPDDDFTRVIREDPERRGLLYAGTETGIYVSFDDGANWQRLQLNLPVVPIHDFVFKDGELAIASHGRSFWIFDDAHVLRQLTPEALASSVHLFKPRRTVRFQDNRRPAAGGLGSTPEPVGENPLNGVVVQYHLGQRPSGEVKLAFLEAGGQVIQEFSSAATSGPKVLTEAGTNRFEWNMLYPAPFVLPGTFFMRYRPVGPQAPPGTYQVRLSVDGRAYTQSFEIVKDPRLPTTPQQFAEQHRLLIAIRDNISKIHQTVGEVRSLRSRVEEAARKAQGTRDAQRVKTLADAVQNKLWEVEDGLIQFRARGNQDLLNYPPMLDDKFSTLAFFIEGSDLPPTTGDHAVFEDLTRRMNSEIAKLEALKKGELAQLGLPAVQ
ncbi:MAG: glycosyl hydrolase, partial [Gemmatimonadetes bacterium]|nr:glycosyl hydrolase [Gemmatimonadota bacterium]